MFLSFQQVPELWFTRCTGYELGGYSNEFSVQTDRRGRKGFMCMGLPNIHLYNWIFPLVPGSILPAPTFWIVEMWLPSSVKERLFFANCWDATLFLTMNLFETRCHLQKRWYKSKNINQVSLSSLFCIYCCSGKKLLCPFLLILIDFFRLTWMNLGSSNRHRFY